MIPMLDDDKKRIIEAEERYRHDIAQNLRSDLAATERDVKNLSKDIWAKVSDILNSNFGIWFLSTVFISGGAAAYQMTQHHYEAKLNTQRQLATCEFEIANRLNAMKFLLQRSKTVGDAQFALTPVSKSLGAVSPEYENVNIAVLYFKVYQLTGTRDMTLANYVKELEEINLSIQKQNPNAILNVEEQKHMISLITDLHRYALDQIYNRKQ
jgi:hypothetical protein